LRTNLITNGDFETGTFAGWTTVSAGGFGNAFYLSGNGSSGPISGNPSQTNPTGGNFNATSDQNGPGGEALLQTFTTVGGTQTLSFDWFDNDHFGQSGGNINGSTQTGRVDIITATADAFDTGAGVVQNLILNQGTVSGVGTSTPWRSSTFTLSLAAGSYQLRFGNGQCCFYHEFGVDNVVLTGVPEPKTWALMLAGFGLAGVALRRWRGTVAA